MDAKKIKNTKVDCGVCVTATAAARFITCPTCGFSCCHGCQRRYERPACMQCREILPRRVAKSLGAEYVRDVLKPEVHAREIAAERHALPSAQEHVDWELEKRRLSARRRFGDATPLPPQPPIPNVENGTEAKHAFACPSSDCRGFVFKNECGTCKAKACMTCRELVQSLSDHVCNPDIVETLKLMTRDCKPCPSCKTPIHKSEGCDHMRCTFCGTRFSYRTLKVMAANTNHHYNDTTLLRPASIANPGGSNGGCDGDDNDDAADAIPRDAYRGPSELIDSLYNDRDCIVYIKSCFFEDEKIVTKAYLALHALRVRYLLNELDEKSWIKRIIAAHETRDGALARASLMGIILAETKSLQRAAHRGASTTSVIKKHLEEVYAMVDENLKEIHAEFGGSLMRMRRSDDPVGTPPVCM